MRTQEGHLKRLYMLNKCLAAGALPRTGRNWEDKSPPEFHEWNGLAVAYSGQGRKDYSERI